MPIEVLTSKIHRVRVTQAELYYVDSITFGENRRAVGDVVRIFPFAFIDFTEVRQPVPTLVFPDQNNRLG